MRIAQVAPLFEPVPPTGYGGTERVVSYLTEELVRRGHNVTLFASGDSATSATLVPCCDHALRGRHDVDTVALHVTLLKLLADRLPLFDLVHFHEGWFHFPMVSGFTVPHVTTLHGRLDAREVITLLKTYPNAPLVSISNSQRLPVSDAHWIETIYHGIPACKLDRVDPEEYLMFIGRLSREKGVEYAIEIARRVGMKLKVAAKAEFDSDMYGIPRPPTA